MATTSSSTTSPGAKQPRATTRKSTGTRRSTTPSKSTGTRRSATPSRSTTPRSATSAARSRGSSRRTSTQPLRSVEQVQQLAERALLVPVGASLLARDNLASTVKGLASRYSSRTSLERELKRYERRGVTARNRLERQVRRSRTRVERELRQRRSSFERSVRQSRRRLEREVGQVRRDLGKRSSIVSGRVEKLVSEAQGLLG